MGTSFPSRLSTRPNSSQRAIENDANASPQAFSDSLPSPLPLCSAKHTVPPAILRKRWDTVDNQLEVSTSRYSCICELVEEFGMGYRPMQLPKPSVDVDPAGNGACGNNLDIDSRRASTTIQIKIAARFNMVQRVVVQMQPHLHLYSPLHWSPPPNLHLPLSHSAKAAKGPLSFARRHPSTSTRTPMELLLGPKRFHVRVRAHGVRNLIMGLIISMW